MDDLKDPWGKYYRFDPDCFPPACQDIDESVITAIYSESPTQAGYDCDDIILEMR